MNEATKEYAAEYDYDGSRWALSFYARDDADAVKKLASLKANTELVGRLTHRIPAQSIVE